MAPIEKRIILDTRENKDSFISYLADTAKINGYEIHMEALPFADINFQNIFVERKEINDFVSSVTSDRMWDQLFQMRNNPEAVSIIMISGGYNKLWKNNKDKIPQITGAFYRIESLGIPVKCFDNDEQLVNYTLKLFDYSKPLDMPVKRIQKDGKTSLFMALPGMGRKTSKILMSEYNNMVELCDASKKDLQDLLGPKKGVTVYDVLRR